MGTALAAELRVEVAVAVFGHDASGVADQIARRGANVVLVDDPALAEFTAGGYAQALDAIRERQTPNVVLFGHTAQGFDVAPFVAARWESPILGNCLGLSVEDGAFIVSRKILNDKLVMEVEVRSERPVVITVRPGSAKPAPEVEAAGRVTRVDATIDPSRNGRVFDRIEKPQVQDIDIAAADIVVSAGRGIQKKENLPVVEELAKTLGGVVGASRPLTDLEWLPKTRQVGQSGKTVRPKLYIACGISGAMQHIAGMKDAGLIIAVNTDPSAPIFAVAHHGVVADVLQFIPALVKELKGG